MSSAAGAFEDGAHQEGALPPARFGPGGAVARPIVGAFCRALSARPRGPAADALRRWRAAQCFEVHSGRADPGGWAARLARVYGTAPDADPHALVLAIHTYLALVLKLLALGVAERAPGFARAPGPSRGCGSAPGPSTARAMQAGLFDGDGAPPGGTLLEQCARVRDPRALGHLLARFEQDDLWTRLGLPGFTRDDPYGWYPPAGSAEVVGPIRDLAREVLALPILRAVPPAASAPAEGPGQPRSRAETAGGPAGGRTGGPRTWVDPAKALYEALLPRELRRSSGEFFTPDWLAELAAEEIGYRGGAGVRVVDPACGSGTFLALAIARLRESLQEGPRRDLGKSRPEDPRQSRRRADPGRGAGDRTLAAIVEQVQGADLNPLAVLAARTTYLLAVRDLVGPGRPVRIPVEVNDALLGAGPPQRADFVLTNPPWVRWSALGEDYRRRLWPQWRRYGLLAARGYKARLATAEVDLAMLFLYAAADRWLGPRGRLASVITIELLRGKTAGQGFRRFHLDPGGESLRPIKVHDLSSVGAFAAANKAGLLLLQKGEEPVYPVPYVVWSAPKGSSANASCRTVMAGPGEDDPAGPWRLTAPEDVPLVERLHRASAYRARRGASTDPYAAYHLELLGEAGEGRLRVANLPGRGKTPAPRIEFECESDLLFPALQGGQIERWRSRPAALVLCPNRSPRQADLLSEKEFCRCYPCAYGYLRQQRELLLARATYWAFYGRDTDLDDIPRARGTHHYRWATRPGRAERVVQVSKAPFYAWRDVGAYSFSAWKVVWGRMSAHLCAAVVGLERVGAGSGKPVLPLDTTAFIACERADEAHFLCALLNTVHVDRALRSLSAPGRGFAAPSAINALALERYDARDPCHHRLVHLSRRCHAASLKGRRELVAQLESEVDSEAARAWGL